MAQKMMNAYQKQEKKDLAWFQPRYEAVQKQLYGNTLQTCVSTSDKYHDDFHPWDAEIYFCNENRGWNAVVELKDRGSGSYRLKDFLFGGRLHDKGLLIDRAKSLEYKKKGSPFGLYVWLFPEDDVMIVGDWREIVKHAWTYNVSVNANTIHSTAYKVEKVNWFIPVRPTVYMHIYQFDENLNVTQIKEVADLETLNK